MKRSWLILTAASLLISLTIPILYGGLDSLHAVRTVSWGAGLLLLLMVLGGWLCNTARIHLLVRALGGSLRLRTVLMIVLASEFAGVATPAGAGNPATYVVLLSRHGMSVSSSAAIIAIDRLTDLVFFGTAIPIAILLFALDSGISHPLRIAALVVVLFLLGLFALVLFLRHYRCLAALLGAILLRTDRLRRFRLRGMRGVLRFRSSIQILLEMGLGRLVLMYLYCLAHWLLRYSILPVVIWIFGQSIPWGYLFVMQGVLLFLGQVTFVPGGGGSVEVGFSALLAPYLSATPTAAALLVWRFTTFYWYLIAGAPVFLLASAQASKASTQA